MNLMNLEFSSLGKRDRLDMAVGTKMIEIIVKDGLLSNSQRIGNMLLKNFVDIIGKGLIDVRGIGLMIGLEFDTKTVRDYVVNRLFKKGLLVLPAGIKSIRIMPPLIIMSRTAKGFLYMRYYNRYHK